MLQYSTEPREIARIVRPSPQTTKAQPCGWAFVVCGEKLPNPCHSVTSPFRGTPPSALLQSGVPAASICLADLADADDAALMRLTTSQLAA